VFCVFFLSIVHRSFIISLLLLLLVVCIIIEILWFLQDATFIQTWQNLHHLSYDNEAVVMAFQSVSFEGVQFTAVGYSNGEVNAVASPAQNLFVCASPLC
jgi:hypothetical protein